MEKMVIRGGTRLKGEVTVSGAKNAALPLMASSILTRGWNTFTGIPRLGDIATMKQLLGHLGLKIEGGKDLRIRADNLTCPEASYNLVKTMRASVLVLGPMLARLGKAKVSLPGGCAIGARPIDLHLRGFEALGAKINLSHGYIEAEAKKLRGNKIYFDTSTVTGTENVLMAACLARGTTVLENAACEPEVAELARVLNKMGARIEGVGTDIIEVEGVDELKGVEHRVMPDRIETGTFMIAAAMTGGEVKIKNCRVEHLDALISKLTEAGVTVMPEDEGMRVTVGDRLRSVDVKTLPYPGFPTDMQAQIMALMCLADSRSVITETVFENRFIHVSELKRMGADIQIQGNSAIVRGGRKLSGAPVMATDLRASASLILAGLAAEGVTEISRIYHLDRGYERIEKKLSRLGADIRRVKG
ncbi:MAG: UDP-N-acetylglucosamine 1-carboxyvinyltransferase [Deltaproteobacteria bacterium]|nr:MAG: UDP-N-acetylglucosamine 1-carboxyvinyltransferase [Deltaproteobacteria bacterium]